MAEFFRDYSDFEPQTLRRTPEGYLTGRLRATCSGVFPYLADGGRKVSRLRPDREVGAADSVASLNSKPVTLRHPDDDVGPDNVKSLQVGFTGTDANWDGEYVSVTMTVTDRDAIRAIESGEVMALSCGYDAVLMPESGNWRGTDYGQVMTGIRYNHVALVKAGRAGDGVRFRIGDCASGMEILNKDVSGDVSRGGQKMKTMIIDGVQCQADEAIVSRIQGLEKELKDARDGLESIKADFDRASAERDASRAECEKLKAGCSDGAISERISAKLALIDGAKKLGIDAKAEDSDDEIRKAVIAKAFDGMDLAGKSADYVSAMYDAAVASLSKVPAAKAEDPKSGLEPDFSKMDDSAPADAEAAYRAMCDRLAGKKLGKEG